MSTKQLPSLRSLRVFQKVAELENIRSAAEAVALSQPSVTQAIRKLEEQIGSPLFERSRNGTFLVEAGRILLPRIEAMFDQMSDALHHFGIAKGQTESHRSILNRLTVQQIRVLFAVATSISFTDAAKRLDISTVSVHRTAREFEESLRKPVFKTVHKGIATTDAGLELARRLTLALREIEFAVEEIDAVNGRRGGTLRLGCMPLSGSYLTGEVISDIEEHFPEANIVVRIGGGPHLTEGLRAGQYDFIIGMNRYALDFPDIQHQKLIASPFVIVSRQDHPLAKADKVEMSDLANFRWVAPHPGAARRTIFDGLFEKMGKPPISRLETNSFATTRSLISGKNWLTMMTQFEFEYESRFSEITTLNFPAIESDASLAVMSRAGIKATPLQQKFLQLIREHAEHYSAQRIAS